MDEPKVGSPAGAEIAPELSQPGATSADGPLLFAESAFVNNSSNAPAAAQSEKEDERTRVSAYARLDFDEFTFYVQTLQVILGRRAQSGQNMVDVHLGNGKAISRRHAKIFYNFATQRFELTVMGRNGAFVNEAFVDHEATVPLKDNTEVRIAQIKFKFVLPNVPKEEGHEDPDATELHQAVSGSEDDENNFFAVQEKKKPKKKPAPEPKEKPKKREYLPEEIPVEFREKPQLSYSVLISKALQERAPDHGLSLADIYEAIMDLFPYYRYCPSGWQNSVRHNLSSSKAFRKVSKEGKGWLWGLDQEYIQEKDKKRAQAKQRRASNDKSIAELAQEIPARKPSESRPRSESGNLLSPQLIRVLSRLQTQLQGHLAKAGGQKINANILSNALAIVVARAAKSSGGIEQLEKILQVPQQVNLILVQALELIKLQTTRRPSEIKKEANEELRALRQQASGNAPVFDDDAPVPASKAVAGNPSGSATASALASGPPSEATPRPSTEPLEPIKEEAARSEQASGAATQSPSPVVGAKPSGAVPAQPLPSAALRSLSDAPGPGAPGPNGGVGNAAANPAPASAGPSAAPVAPATVSAAAPAPAVVPAPAAASARPKYTAEQIATLLAQAERVPNPSPSILAAIEQLRAHQRAMLKRPAPEDSQPKLMKLS